MSENKKVSPKRLLQYKKLKEWDDSKITGEECIEDILDLEKVLYLDSIREDKKDEQEKD